MTVLPDAVDMLESRSFCRGGVMVSCECAESRAAAAASRCAWNAAAETGLLGMNGDSESAGEPGAGDGEVRPKEG